MRLPSVVMVNDNLQVWCEIKTPEALLGQVLGDPHSPGRFRVVSASHPQHALNQNTYIFFSLHPEFPSCLDRSSWKFWRLPSCLWVSSWQRYEQAWKNTATAWKWLLTCICCCIVMLMVDVEGSEGSELTFNHIRGDEKCLLWWALLNSWHADPHYQPQFSWICICKTFCIICCWKIWNDIRPCFNEYLFLYKT